MAMPVGASAVQGAMGPHADSIGGPLGMSPAPASAFATPVPGGAPTGTSPTAKRPSHTRASDVAMQQDGGPSKVMGTDELTHGFYNLVRLQARDEQFNHGVAVAVHENAGLLNAVITRMNAVEASGQLMADAVNKLRVEHEALIGDTRKAIVKVDDRHIVRDTTLRQELDGMAARLEAGHKELTAMIEKAGPPGVPTSVAGLGLSKNAFASTASGLTYSWAS